jgi:hypothetical protein
MLSPIFDELMGLPSPTSVGFVPVETNIISPAVIVFSPFSYSYPLL